MLAGIPAAALGSNVAVFPNFLAILLPFLVPYAGQQLLTGEIDQVAAGLAALIYAAVLAGIGRALSRHIAESFELRFENVDLVERLSTANEFLQREVRRREETEEGLRHARDGAEAASQAKSRFLARMSHEIRTPMNGVLGMTALLLESPLSSQQRRFGEIIDDSARSLLNIIDDILDFSRVEAGKLLLEDEDFDLRAMVLRAVELLSSRARAKALQLTWTVEDGVPERARGDSGRLRQILLNLIANAIKFTVTGSVAVRVQLEPGGPATSRASVLRWRTLVSGSPRRPGKRSSNRLPRRTNRAPGASGELASVGDMPPTGGADGWTDRSRERSRQGLEVLVHGAAQGSERPPPAGPVLGAARAGGDASPLGGTVLLVEDNAVNREVAVAILHSLGCAVEVAEDGASALAARARRRYEAILMDSEMPGMDGYAATAAIRELETAEQVPPTPIIALSAHAMPEDRERALAAGMDDTSPSRFRPCSCAACWHCGSRRGGSGRRGGGGSPARTFRRERDLGVARRGCEPQSRRGDRAPVAAPGGEPFELVAPACERAGADVEARSAQGMRGRAQRRVVAGLDGLRDARGLSSDRRQKAVDELADRVRGGSSTQLHQQVPALHVDRRPTVELRRCREGWLRFPAHFTPPPRRRRSRRRDA